VQQQQQQQTAAAVMMACMSTLTSSAAGMRPAAARPQRAGGVTARAASTRMPGGDNKDSHSQPASPSTSTSGRSEDVITLAATLGLTGASIGTYLDGIHSRVGVLVYDKAPIIHGSLHTSAFVPPLLAAFYMVLGGLYVPADSWLLERGDTATQTAYRRCNLGTMCLSFGGLAATLALSSAMYAADMPADQISQALAVCAAANYLIFDGTKQGLGLALLCALACPASELMLMHIGQVWHYPGATAFTEIPHSGMPSWVPWCYFIYTSAISQLTRFLKKTC
jgi:hypothetical protein